MQFSDSKPYPERLQEARERSGGREAVMTGTARLGGRAVVVFWDRVRRGALAFYPNAGAQALNFEVRVGSIIDLETESTWTAEGLGASGPLAGTQLEPVAEAYVAFWFAWAAFHPTTQLWEAR